MTKANIDIFKYARRDTLFLALASFTGARKPKVGMALGWHFGIFASGPGSSSGEKGAACNTIQPKEPDQI